MLLNKILYYARAWTYVGLYFLLLRSSNSLIDCISYKKLEKVFKFAVNNSEFYNIKYSKQNPLNNGNHFNDELPTLKKEEIRENLSTMLTGQNSVTEYHTSGSTGLPLKLYRSRNDDLYNYVSWLRSYLENHFYYGFFAFVFDGLKRGRVFRFLREDDFYRTRNPMILEVPISLPAKKAVKIMKSFRPTMLEGYPTDITNLTREMVNEADPIRLNKIITHSELLVESERRLISEITHGNIIDLYGSQEFGCIAWQCKNKHYHINQDLFYCEVKTDNGVRRYGKGEIIITSLYNRAMPLIRYELGDVVDIAKNQGDCYIKTDIIKVIEGKTYDFVYTSDGNIVSPHYLKQILGSFKLIREFRVVQYRNNYVVIQYVPSKDLDQSSKDLMIEKLAEVFGNNTQILLEKKDTIERKGNKFKTIIHSEESYEV